MKSQSHTQWIRHYMERKTDRQAQSSAKVPDMRVKKPSQKKCILQAQMPRLTTHGSEMNHSASRSLSLQSQKLSKLTKEKKKKFSKFEFRGSDFHQCRQPPGTQQRQSPAQSQAPHFLLVLGCQALTQDWAIPAAPRHFPLFSRSPAGVCRTSPI